jgi:carbonic anhydrase
MKLNLALSMVCAAACGLAALPAFAAPHWDYLEQDHWAEVEDHGTTLAPPFNFPFAECGIGQHQSPVDLTGGAQGTVNGLKWSYPKADQPTYLNNGHAGQVTMPLGYAGALSIGKDAYPLIQFHLHAPSEHVVNGVAHDAELHYVHVRNDGKIAVLGVFLDVGAENPALDRVLKNIPLTEGSVVGPAVSPGAFLPAKSDRQSFYTYAGSLTTPPCSEGVSWYVQSQPITLSAAQLDALKAIHDENARHAQPANGRVVTTTFP